MRHKGILLIWYIQFKKTMNPFAFFVVVGTVINATQPDGKYCGNVIGNKFIMDVNPTSNLVNVSAYILGSQISCPNEPYQYNESNFHIYLSEDQDDCINDNLKKHGACPCPPELVYDADDNQLIMQHTPIGSITMKSC